MRVLKIAAVATPMVAFALVLPTILGGKLIGASDECELSGELALTEEWRYAPPETSPYDRLIGLSSSVARHPESGVYVVDLLGSAVLHLSLDGDFIRRIGRRGEGPGEFQSPTIVRESKSRMVTRSTVNVGANDSFGPRRRTFSQPANRRQPE